MRRILVVLTMAVVMAAIMVVMAAPALAQGEGPKPNPHNCGGTSSVETREQLGGGREFGEVVSDEAHDQNIDNLTHANCDRTPRQNP